MAFGESARKILPSAIVLVGQGLAFDAIEFVLSL
jgi:hypothetical protein